MTDISDSQVEAAAKAFDDENVRLGAPRCGNYYFEHRLKPAINKALRAALSTPAAKREEAEINAELLSVAKLYLSLGDHPQDDPFAQAKILLLTEVALAAVAKAEGR